MLEVNTRESRFIGHVTSHLSRDLCSKLGANSHVPCGGMISIETDLSLIFLNEKGH